MEQWEPAFGYADFYEVSDRGRVRRTVCGHCGAPLARNARTALSEGERNGYAFVNLYAGKRKAAAVSVHRLVVQTFIRPLRDGEVPNHKNFDRGDNRIENLEIVTASENLRHALSVPGRKAWRANRGNGNGNAVLDDFLVGEIRRLYKRRSFGVGRVAESLGVTYNSVYGVVSGRTWKYPNTRQGEKETCI
jgi:hypothetical protein